MSYSEAARLRLEDDEFGAELSQAVKPQSTGSQCVVLKTATQTTYPTAANRFYHCEIQGVLGTETEGGTATNTGSGRYIKAYNYGSGIPPSGTVVIGRTVDWATVFRYP